MVLHRQDDPLFGGMIEQFSDALDHPPDSLLARDLGPPLAGKNTAVTASEKGTHVDHALLAFDFLPALPRVGLGEVGRAAEHRHGEAAPFERRTHSLEIVRLQRFEKAVVKLHSLDGQVRSHGDPVEQAHAALDHDVIHEALGKSCELHRESCQFSVFSLRSEVEKSTVEKLKSYCSTL